MALGFVASVVAHELAHALVGRSRGVPSSRIVRLGFMGRLAPLSIQARRPVDELAIAFRTLLSLSVARLVLPLAIAAGWPPGLRCGGRRPAPGR